VRSSILAMTATAVGMRAPQLLGSSSTRAAAPCRARLRCRHVPPEVNPESEFRRERGPAPGGGSSSAPLYDSDDPESRPSNPARGGDSDASNRQAGTQGPPSRRRGSGGWTPRGGAPSRVAAPGEAAA
jgi:hypothetical protein